MALNSTSTIKIIDLLCEGPIEGIEGAKKGIFLDETPVATENKLNVSNEHFTYEQRFGTKDQDLLSGYQTGGASNLVNFSEEIGSNYSETKNNKNKVTERNYGFGKTIKQITDNDTTSVEFLFTIPALFCTAMEGVARGQLFNATTRIRIFFKSQGTGFREVYDKRFTGISTSSYQFKTPRINIEFDEDGNPRKSPFLFKIQKITNRENDYEVRKEQFEDIDINTPLEGTRANRVILTSMIERQDFKSRYPFTACVGLSLSTEAFASLPTRAYLVKGMRVKIPHNATVRSDGSLRFTGSFNGSLAVGRHWTTCPVCIFFDMLTSDKHGAGDFITASNISWVDLYPLSQYANELVETPDGNEPRFAINTVIGAQNEAYKVLQNLASTFRGMTYWAANTVNVGADHGNLKPPDDEDAPDIDPVHLYTNANVIGGVFTYTGTSLKTRSTSIRVRYNDPDNLYKPNVVVVEDYNLITKYGYQVKDIVAFGCSSKYQAQRLGTWILKSEELDAEVVVFKTGLDGLAVLPSQVFAVADEMRQGVQRAGRISTGATTTSITLDKDLSSVLSSNPTSFTLNCTLPDGTVESKTISAVSGSTVTTAAFSAAPQSQSVYTITSSTLKHQKFRCIDVIDNNDGTYTIEGVQFNDSIYAAVDDILDDEGKLKNVPLVFTDITAFDEHPTPPTDLQHSIISIN